MQPIAYMLNAEMRKSGLDDDDDDNDDDDDDPASSSSTSCLFRNGPFGLLSSVSIVR